MGTTTNQAILDDLELELSNILIASGYNTDIGAIDREYKEHSSMEYPFIFINDIDDKYMLRICKDLYQKGLVVQIVGFVYSDCHTATDSTKPQLGTKLQQFKDDVAECLSRSTFFNTSDLELQIIEITTEGNYQPPEASFVCNILVIHYDTR